MADTQEAVWKLRSRGCWVEAVRLLDAESARAADSSGQPCAKDRAGRTLRRTMLLVERCMFTAQGWGEAEDALRSAEAAARSDEERGAAACERGYLAYAATLLGGRDRSDEARSALGRSAALLAPGDRGRPLLDFRRGLVAQNLSHHASAARAAYRRAHNGAVAHGDELLCSYTWRHLAALSLEDGDVTQARHGFQESLRLRESLGYLIGVAPALTALAQVEPEPEAARLREEAARLVRVLGGIPVWLAAELASPPAADSSAHSD